MRREYNWGHLEPKKKKKQRGNSLLLVGQGSLVGNSGMVGDCGLLWLVKDNHFLGCAGTPNHFSLLGPGCASPPSAAISLETFGTKDQSTPLMVGIVTAKPAFMSRIPSLYFASKRELKSSDCW